MDGSCFTQESLVQNQIDLLRVICVLQHMQKYIQLKISLFLFFHRHWQLRGQQA